MSPRRALMCIRGSFNDPTAEIESALVEHDGRMSTITLDDGEELTFDRIELRAALDATDQLEAAA